MIIEKTKNVVNSIIINNKKKEEIPVFRSSLLVQDLDKFFKEIYTYYYLGGYKYIKKQIVLDIIIYLFTTHFIMFIFFGIEWNKLFNLNQNIIGFSYLNNSDTKMLNVSYFSNITNNSILAIDKNNSFNNNLTNKTIINNNTIKEFYELKNYISFSLFYKHKIIAIIFYFLFMHYLLKYFYTCLVFLKRMKYIKGIYKDKFYLQTKDLERISFNNILNLLIDLQNKENYCRVKDKLTKYDIICRICRKDNYVTALSFFNILKFNLFGFDLMSNFIYNKFKSNFMSLLFNDCEAEINKNFFNKKYFKICMIIQILFQIIKMPPEIILRITFFLIKKVDKFQSNEKQYKNRWDRPNLLLFKNYNELKHHFRKRISKSYMPTNKFLKCFGNKKISLLFHTIKLVSIYTLLFITILILFVGSNISQIRIFNINFVSVAIIIIIIIGLINYLDNGEGAGADTIENFDEKNNSFKEIVKYLENIPNNWERYKIYKNYEFIYKSYTNNIYHFFREILSVFFQPILWIKLIYNYNEISTFIRTFSIDLEGIGTICSFSVLNLKEYIKIQEQINNLYKQNNNISKNYTVKFLNSLIYFEKYFSYKDLNIENNYNNNNDINKEKENENEKIAIDEERIFLKENEKIEEFDNDKEIEEEVKIIDIITEKIYNNYKAKINIEDIKDNIAYYINNEKNINYNEIIKILYEQKYGFVNV